MSERVLEDDTTERELEDDATLRVTEDHEEGSAVLLPFVTNKLGNKHALIGGRSL